MGYIKPEDNDKRLKELNEELQELNREYERLPKSQAYKPLCIYANNFNIYDCLQTCPKNKSNFPYGECERQKAIKKNRDESDQKYQEIKDEEERLNRLRTNL